MAQVSMRASKNKLSAHKTRSVHKNIYMASDSGGETSQVIWSEKRLQVMASSPTDSKLFTHFVNGLRSSIGEIRNQDAAISIALMIKMQQLLELEWQMEVKQDDKESIRTAADNGLFHIFTYCGILKGYETPKVILHDIHRHILSSK